MRRARERQWTKGERVREWKCHWDPHETIYASEKFCWKLDLYLFVENNTVVAMEATLKEPQRRLKYSCAWQDRVCS